MKVVIRIHVYGELNKLLTLKREEEVPSGIYSSSPVNTSIEITRYKKVFSRLVVDYQDLFGEAVTYMTNQSDLKISDLLNEQNMNEFDELVGQMKDKGWEVERYEDSIHHYFSVDYSEGGLEMDPRVMTVSKVLLFLAVVIMPAASVWLYINQVITSPLQIGISYISALFILYYLSVKVWSPNRPS